MRKYKDENNKPYDDLCYVCDLREQLFQRDALAGDFLLGVLPPTPVLFSSLLFRTGSSFGIGIRPNGFPFYLAV